MSFNWKTFQTRTLTAIIFAAVMLTSLLWNQWSFLVLFSVIHFGCWWEYFNLLEKIQNTLYHRHTRLGFMLLGYAIMLWFCSPAYEVNNYRLRENFAFPVSIAGFVMLGMGIFQSKHINFKSFGTAVLGLFYISLCWGLMLSLRSWGLFDYEKEFWNKALPLGLVLSIWTNDTMAYIVGSLIGKTPFSKISPKKTWEGTLGGIILCVLVITLVFYYSWNIFTLKDWVAISSIAAIFGTLGDLLESKFKRMAGVKDSGSIMPGHGGFLDRFDSMLLATPAVWLYVQLFL
jgi:phosphatidate cytidylyltransferase